MEPTKLADIFNGNPFKAIEKIKELAQGDGIDPKIAIANFLFYATADHILNKGLLSYYLGRPGEETDEHKVVLEHFTTLMAKEFQGKSFTDSLRIFLDKVAIINDAIITAHLLEGFARSYLIAKTGKELKQDYANIKNIQRQNNLIEDIKFLTAQSIILDLNLYLPEFKEKMDLNNFINGIQGANILNQSPQTPNYIRESTAYDVGFLTNIYSEIKKDSIKPQMISLKSEGIERVAKNMDQRNIIQNLHKFLETEDKQKFYEAFPQLERSLKLNIDKRLAWLNKLTGYEGTVTLKDKEGAKLVVIDIYIPNIFSRIFFSKEEKINIRPLQLSQAKQNDVESWARTSKEYSNKYKVKSQEDENLKSNISKWEEIASQANKASQNEKLRTTQAESLAISLISHFNNPQHHIRSKALIEKASR